MSRASEKLALPDQANRLIDRHAAMIERETEEISRKLASTTSVLSATCHILSLRQRYLGAAGEHFSVHAYEGIQIVDTLDERLLQAVRSLLRRHLDRMHSKPDPEALALLETRLTPGLKEIPQYPVGYMIHFVIQNAFPAFELLAEKEQSSFAIEDLELALMQYVLSILDKYAQTREKPVMRHFSDVAREYTVVMRLKCDCGADHFDVKLQTLCQTPTGEPFDRLELQCRECEAQRTITFDLPHFKDMMQI